MKRGFTLAEVLIVLGIVGIVAAMTLPTLIQNYQKKVWVTSLKKDFTMIQNACRMMLANDGVDTISETEFGKALRNSDFPSFENEIKKYFSNVVVMDKPLNLKNWVRLNGSSFDKFGVSINKYSLYLANSDIGFDTNGYSLSVILDVNGSINNPNKVGADIFGFSLGDDCRVILLHFEKDQECGTGHIASPVACFQDVMQNGWEYKYQVDSVRKYNWSKPSGGHHGN